jgi:hypothetical protein
MPGEVDAGMVNVYDAGSDDDAILKKMNRLLKNEEESETSPVWETAVHPDGAVTVLPPDVFDFAVTQAHIESLAETPGGTVRATLVVPLL